MMTDEYKVPGSLASLPVLTSNPGVDELRREIVESAGQAKAAVATSDVSASVAPSRRILEGKIIEAISKVYDPEIPVNVYELGLIYGIDISPDNSVTIRMTLTAPGCPVAGSLPKEVEKQVESIDEVKEAEVVLVWEPAWDKSRMSESALLQLGM